MPPTVKKIEVLDSIRGIAAFVVMLSHFMNIFFPAIVFGGKATIHTHFDVFIFQSPLSIFFAGNFAVIVFFILSGFVLTFRYLSGKQKTLFPAALKRYVRLMPIVFVSVMLGYVLMALGLMFFAGVGKLSGSEYAGAFFGFEPHLFDAIAQGLYGSFIIEADSATSYNPVLWTIHFELLGSFLVFGLATMSRNHPKRWILYGIAALAFLNTYFVGFMIGLILADIYVSKPAWFERVHNLSWVYKWALLIFALSIAAFPLFGEQKDFGSFWNAMIIFEDNLLISRTILQLIAGVIVITLALSWAQFAKVLANKYLVRLGKISYALYAVHFILIYSVSSWAVQQFDNFMPYKFAALASIVVSIPVILSVAALLHRYIELPSIAIANRIGEWSKK